MATQFATIRKSPGRHSADHYARCGKCGTPGLPWESSRGTFPEALAAAKKHNHEAHGE